MANKKTLEFLFLFGLVTLTWIVSIFHLGTAPSPTARLKSAVPAESKWIPKEVMGINQLVLKGSDVQRGLAAGEHTRELLHRQESELQTELKTLIPLTPVRHLFFLGAMRWFYGIELFLDRSHLDEMWGVSRSASNEFNFLADPYTRQIAYHGLHEVGQSMVDFDPQGFACTVIAVPQSEGWLIGRNFDFEGGRVFDEEKIMKWVFPDTGNAYLSVIWAGMVGAVTGINSKGIYLSLNAAGTKDFRRLGTPSTLVLLKALENANTLEDARKIIEDSQLFISDIFVVAQSGIPYFYRIEKTPLRFVTKKETGPTAITNHFISTDFKNDAVNTFRREKMTSLTRLTRAEKLLKVTAPDKVSPTIMLKYLRDHEFPLGNRGSIDAFIATHSVIWDSTHGRLYVSQGPSLQGKFIGFDLESSFQNQNPNRIDILPEDSTVSAAQYDAIQTARQLVKEARRERKSKHHERALMLLTKSIEEFEEDYEAYLELGILYDILQQREKAQENFKRALSLVPANDFDLQMIKRKLGP